MKKQMRRAAIRFDLTKAAYTFFGAGVKRGNPRRCFECGKSFKRGETWRKDASAQDPDGYGRIVTMQHSPQCPDEGAREKFQKGLGGNKRSSH